MDFEVIWTEPAAQQFEQIIRFIANDRPAAAENVRRDILERVGGLSLQPFIGPIYEKDRKGRSREIFCGNYRIFCRVDEAARRIEVLMVRHGARKEPRLPK